MDCRTQPLSATPFQYNGLIFKSKQCEVSPPGKNQSKLSPFLCEYCSKNGLLFRLVCHSSPLLCTTSRSPGCKSSAIFGKGCNMRFILCCFDQDGGCGRSKVKVEEVDPPFWEFRKHHFPGGSQWFMTRFSMSGPTWWALSPRSHKVTEWFWVL